MTKSLSLFPAGFAWLGSAAVSAEKPDIVLIMADQWQAWADPVGVQPWPFEKKKKS